jgi:hypothetical protein
MLTEDQQAEAAAADTEAQAAPDYVSRYKEAGMDLSALDPAEVASALESARQSKGRDLVDRSEVDTRANSVLAGWLQNPQYRQQLASYLGVNGQPAQSSADGAAPPDEVETKYKRLEQGMGMLASYVQQLEKRMSGHASTVDAKEKVGNLASLLSRARQAIEDAADVPELDERFYSDVALGRVPKDASEIAVRKWVSDRVKAFNSAHQQRSDRRRPAGISSGQGGTAVLAKLDPSKLTDEQIVSQVAAAFGLPKE